MQKIEMCVDALLRLAVAEDSESQKKARQDIKELIDTKSIDVVVSAGETELVIRDILFDLGCPEHLIGHEYVVRAIRLAVEDRMYIMSITFGLYPQLAVDFDTTPARVERAIRHLIEVTWSRGDINALEKYFGNTVSPERGRPTNGEFISRIANVVKMRLKEAA